MKKGKKLLLLTIMLISVFSLAACSSVTDAALVKPNVTQQSNDMSFRWRAVENATSYIMNLDGKEQNIGNPISSFMDDGLTMNMVEYSITDKLEPGAHSVKFATVYKTKISAYSKDFEIIVGTNSELNAPRISLSGDALLIDSSYHSFIIRINGESIEFFKESDAPGSFDLKSVGGLTNGNSYSVTVIAISTDTDKQSQPSNIVDYDKTESGAKYAKPSIETINKQTTLIFKAQLTNPTIIVYVNNIMSKVSLKGTMYSAPIDMAFIAQLSPSTMMEIAKGDAAIKFQIVSDNKNLERSDVSESVTVNFLKDQNMKFEEIVKGAVTANTSPKTGFPDGTLFVSNSLVGINDVQISVTDGGNTIGGIVIDNGTDSGTRVTAYDVASSKNAVKVTVFSLTNAFEQIVIYERLEQKIESPKNVAINGSNITWTAVPGAEKYIITAKVDGVEQTLESRTSFISFKGIVGSEFEVVISTVIGNGKSAPSSTLIFKKITKNSNISVWSMDTDIQITNTSGYKYIVAYKNNNGTIVKIDTDSNLPTTIRKSSIGKESTITITDIGNNIDMMDSEERNYKVNFIAAPSYQIVGGEFLQAQGVEDLRVRYELDDGSMSDYTEESGKTFNLLKYLDAHSMNSITFRERDKQLKENETTVITENLVVNCSNRCVTPTFDQDNSSKTERIIRWNSAYLATYRVEVYSYANEMIYTVTNGDSSYNFSALEVGGYYLKVRQLGAGDKLGSKLMEMTFKVVAAVSDQKFYTDGASNNYLYWINNIELSYTAKYDSYEVVTISSRNENGIYYNYISLGTTTSRNLTIYTEASGYFSNIVTTNETFIKIKVDYVNQNDEYVYVRALADFTPKKEIYNGVLGALTPATHDYNDYRYTSIMGSTDWYSTITLGAAMAFDVSDTQKNASITSIVVANDTTLANALPKYSVVGKVYEFYTTSTFDVETKVELTSAITANISLYAKDVTPIV